MYFNRYPPAFGFSFCMLCLFKGAFPVIRACLFYLFCLWFSVFTGILESISVVSIYHCVISKRLSFRKKKIGTTKKLKDKLSVKILIFKKGGLFEFYNLYIYTLFIRYQSKSLLVLCSLST